jgi:hypothetical protein
LFVIVSCGSGFEAGSATGSEAALESAVLTAPIVAIVRNSRRFIFVRRDNALLYCAELLLVQLWMGVRELALYSGALFRRIFLAWFDR